MAADDKKRVCPVERAGALDNSIRRWFQNPSKILRPYLEQGMTVLDVGCGSGFFTLDMAQMVGESGKVIASDLQVAMLQKLREKAEIAALENRILVHKTEKDKVGVTEPVDFILLFYVVHEVPNAEDLFKEMLAILKPGGEVLVVEPPFHVKKAEFEKTVKLAQDVGFTVAGRPKIFLSKAAVLKKA